MVRETPVGGKPYDGGNTEGEVIPVPISNVVRGAAVSAVFALLAVACGPGGNESSQDQRRPVALPRDCLVKATEPNHAFEALGKAEAGATVCIMGDLMLGSDLVLTRSGTPGRPIIVAADGAVIGSLTVDADHVLIQGFTIVGGEGIVLKGRNLRVRGNEVRDAKRDGISCEDVCTDVVIEENKVVAADGSGILVEGQRITIRANEVRGSVSRESGDADGIRFFGGDISILDNSVIDIKDDGYGDERPHTDCFQTYDNGSPPTVSVIIAANICRNVDHQCLIATAEEAGISSVIGRSRGIEFIGNDCDVEGSQAVFVRWFPDVVVRGNTFAGPNFDRVAAFLDGSTGGEFSSNSVPGSVVPYQLDPSSEPGFIADRPR